MGRPVPLRFKEVADLTTETVLSGKDTMSYTQQELAVLAGLLQSLYCLHNIISSALASGIIISQGVAKGTARVLKSVAEASSIQQGDILIVAIPEVGWTYYFPLLGGLVTEIGGILSHGRHDFRIGT